MQMAGVNSPWDVAPISFGSGGEIKCSLRMYGWPENWCTGAVTDAARCEYSEELAAEGLVSLARGLHNRLKFTLRRPERRDQPARRRHESRPFVHESQHQNRPRNL